jgi:hypothetical protein
LNEDIAYIEAQSQGLQVQAANQKLLQAELNSLLKTVSISISQLQPLKESSLESPQGLDQIERALVLLFKAMITIDPTLSSLSSSRASEDDSSPDKFGKSENSDISSMRVLQEKKEMYKTESTLFLRRLKQFLQVKFAAAFDECKKGLERQKESALNRRTGKNKLDPKSHDMTRNILWKYSPLMLFLREIDRIEWEEFMKIYVSASRPIYQEEARDAVAAWQRNAKKPSGDEHEVLFTSQVEKQTEGIATTARKLTVKRSQTLAKSLRSPLGVTVETEHRPTKSRMAAYPGMRSLTIFSTRLYPSLSQNRILLWIFSISPPSKLKILLRLYLLFLQMRDMEATLRN